MIFGLVAVVALGALTGWLGYRDHESWQAHLLHDSFLQAGRQAALNLTSINYNEVDADLGRIIEGATGTFRDDFRQRAPSFAQFVKEAQSVSEGKIVEAAVESEQGDQAQVLVAVVVKTSTSAAHDQEPRYWRMRIGVQKVAGSPKISQVEFVP
ncbi:mammalian cell entry protein [Mycobacterium paraense]|uniref:Mammalian cell entry protein n=1 Tax=Mycobacterium paraense TaxID=767916 RepID=A0ABX3VS38_9MYCO|nr:mammalian cell entry protein [Mycobacterium paraense]ORW45102.1 mammalian cell entry protein [Mycobacterium paraense]